LFTACSREKRAVEQAAPAVAAPANAAEPMAPAKAADTTELRQAVSEAETSLRAGSYDEAAARLLKLRRSGMLFSDKDAAAYRNALQEAYSRALDAASKGDPRGKAAVQMIRAAGPR